MAAQNLNDVLSVESGLTDYSSYFDYSKPFNRQEVEQKKEKTKTETFNHEENPHIRPAVACGLGGATLLGLGYYVFNTNKAISLAYILSGAGLLAMSIGSMGLGLGAILGISLASAWYANHGK